jgi:hypothetical protein
MPAVSATRSVTSKTKDDAARSKLWASAAPGRSAGIPARADKSAILNDIMLSLYSSNEGLMQLKTAQAASFV